MPEVEVLYSYSQRDLISPNYVLLRNFFPKTSNQGISIMAWWINPWPATKHLLWVSVWVLTTLFLIQLHLNAPWKVMKASLSGLALDPAREIQMGVPGSWIVPWPSPGCCGHLVSEPVDLRSLALLVSLYLCLSNKTNRSLEKKFQSKSTVPKAHFRANLLLWRDCY